MTIDVDFRQLLIVVSCTILLFSGRGLSGQIQLNNDEFSDLSTLINWKNINQEEGWNITQLENYNIGDSVSGSLFMLPITESWFGEYRGAYLYKEIAGDFVLTTRVSMASRDGVGLPISNFSLAGIMIREPVDYPNQDPEVDWIPGEQNYIFMSVGRANQNRLSFEIKNTCNSQSCLNIEDADGDEVYMRMIRRGSEIVVMSSYNGDNWFILGRYNRNSIQQGNLGSCGQPCNAPFPDTIQIGFVTYTDWEKVSSYDPSFHNANTLHPDSLDTDPTPTVPFSPDIKSSYDFVRFDSLTIPQEWMELDLSNTSDISDEALLERYSFFASPYCPTTAEVSVLPIDDPYTIIRAQDLITSTTIVSPGKSVQMITLGEIRLEAEFQVDLGASLTTDSEGCPE